MSVELEKTTNGQVRIKFSTEEDSTFLLNSTNVSISADPLNINFGTSNFTIKGVGFNYLLKLKDITSINGDPAPDNLEDTMLLIANEVFAG